MTDNRRPAEFDAKLLAYLPKMRAQARRLLPHHPQDREDLVQETFCVALNRWSQFRPEGGFIEWLRLMMMGIWKNQCQKRSEVADGSEADPSSSANSNQDDRLSITEIDRRWPAALTFAIGHTMSDAATLHKTTSHDVARQVKNARAFVRTGRIPRAYRRAAA